MDIQIKKLYDAEYMGSSGTAGNSGQTPKPSFIKKAWTSLFTLKNVVVLLILIGGIYIISRINSCNPKFSGQIGSIDSISLANQKLVTEKNKLNQTNRK